MKKRWLVSSFFVAFLTVPVPSGATPSIEEDKAFIKDNFRFEVTAVTCMAVVFYGESLFFKNRRLVPMRSMNFEVVERNRDEGYGNAIRFSCPSRECITEYTTDTSKRVVKSEETFGRAFTAPLEGIDPDEMMGSLKRFQAYCRANPNVM
ncbi:hypothetical protein AWB71_01809 [Caballeronia peredens]|nr:hypothetical protein AWB71_01809 [Caballeronia peredens]